VPIILTLVLGGISIYTQDTFKHTELNKELKESKGSNIDIKSLYEHELDYKSSEVDNNKKEVLVINEANPMLLDDIRVNPRKYIGRNLEISGFVCKESYLNKNQFIIGRIVMTCCAADSKVVGIIGEYDKSYDLHENEKIIVRGTIGSSIIKDDNNISHTIPVIIIEHLDVEE
jgi:putative membrane protein